MDRGKDWCPEPASPARRHRVANRRRDHLVGGCSRGRRGRESRCQLDEVRHADGRCDLRAADAVRLRDVRHRRDSCRGWRLPRQHGRGVQQCRVRGEPGEGVRCGGRNPPQQRRNEARPHAGGDDLRAQVRLLRRRSQSPDQRVGPRLWRRPGPQRHHAWRRLDLGVQDRQWDRFLRRPNFDERVDIKLRNRRSGTLGRRTALRAAGTAAPRRRCAIGVKAAIVCARRPPAEWAARRPGDGSSSPAPASRPGHGSSSRARPPSSWRWCETRARTGSAG